MFLWGNHDEDSWNIIITLWNQSLNPLRAHYSDVIASQITCLTIVYSTVYSRADQRKHQSFAPLAFVRGIHRGPVNSPHKCPVTRKLFPFDVYLFRDTYRNCYIFYHFPYGNGAGRWSDTFYWKTKPDIDDLVTQGPKASTSILLF